VQRLQAITGNSGMTASLSTGNGRETVKSIGTEHSIFFKT